MPASTTKINSEGLYAYDTEVYPNYILWVFKAIRPSKDGEFFSFTWDQREELKSFVGKHVKTLVGYNNFDYDDPILRSTVDGTNQSLDDAYAISEANFSESKEDETWLFSLRGKRSSWTCIDLMQIRGGKLRAGSLKSHEVRLGMANVQDLPIPPGTILSKKQQSTILEYCRNDVHATEHLYWDQIETINVRHKVNERFPYLKSSALRKSDSSIADSVVRGELRRYGLEKRQVTKPKEFSFIPDQDLDSSVHFIGQNNQAVLARLRALGEFPAEDWKELSARFEFETKTHKITLGAGGLHLIIPAQCVKSNAIIEYDVASYYPSLLRKFNRHPVGLIDAWNKIFYDLTDARLKAKADRDKATADVYKIIINSIYGKLLQENSINYDPSLQLRVVINGQLYLLMLIERFEELGLKVISANTDGVYVDAGAREQEAQAVATQWEADTGFTLESKVATIYVASSVNNYALFHPDGKWFHKKGTFGAGNRTSPQVITDAVLHHFSTGKDVERFVRQSKNILDFLYSRSVRGAGIGDVRHGTEIVQKTNRWYRSTSGIPIEECVGNQGSRRKWKQVANSESCTMANNLTDWSIPSELDLDYYVDEANELLNKINASTPAKKASQSKLIRQAKNAQKLGLVVVPKGRSGEDKAGVLKTYEPDTIQYWRDTPLEKADWTIFRGFGAYTGKEFGILGIDIDDLDVARKTDLFKHPLKGCFVAWHGKVESDEVRNGNYRGTLIFKYRGDDLRTTGGSFLKSNGFELLYGKEVVQLGGPYGKEESYQFEGELTELPAGLRKSLEWLIDVPGTSSPADDSTVTADQSESLLMQFMAAANGDLQYVNVGGLLQLKTLKNGDRCLTGLCIGHQAHTNKTNEQTMTVAVYRGSPKVNCRHLHCEETRKAWETRICKDLVIARKVIVKPENVVIREDQKEIAAALNAPDRYKLILASTGSGKTHNIVTSIAPLLDAESGNTDKFAIICSTKDQMEQIAKRFGDVLESTNINEQGIDLIEATQSMQIGQAISRETVRAVGTRVAITHYTYVSRKGFGLRHRAFLKFIDSTTNVFIDEIDAYVVSQTTNYPFGSRWRRIGTSGRFKYVRMTKCGMFHGFNNCMNCEMRQYDGNRLTTDKYNNDIYTGIHEIIDGEPPRRLPRIELDSRILSRVIVGTTEIRMLRQEVDPGEIRFDDESDFPDFVNIMEDHLKSAYLPTVHRPIIVLDGEEITRKEFMDQFLLTEGSSRADLSESDRARLKFPSRVCNALTLTMVDRRPFIWMAHAKSVTGLTATLTPFQQRFLGDMFEGLTQFNIPPREDLKMDKIIVVGMSRQIPVRMFVEERWQFDKMFRFRETEAKANEDYDLLRRSGVLITFGHDKNKFMISGENAHAHHKILQTYSFGSLGRGVDFAEYDLIDVNASIYKPISAFVTDDPDAIHDLVLMDRAGTLIQNIGRILRRSKTKTEAVKVVVLEELNSEEELNAVVKQIAPMSHVPVESWWVPEFIANEEVCERLTTIGREKALPADLPRNIGDLIGRAEKLITQGEDKKSIKDILRWKTVRKKLTQAEVSEVENAIDELLDNRDPSVRAERLKTDEKVAKTQERREKKIRELHIEGKTAPQIHSRMRISGWAESEQRWFESVIRQLEGEATVPKGPSKRKK